MPATALRAPDGPRGVRDNGRMSQQPVPVPIRDDVIRLGQFLKLADLAVLSADYLSVPTEEIGDRESLLTIVSGEVVYAAGDVARLAR